MNVDLKSFDERAYKKVQNGNLSDVMKTRILSPDCSQLYKKSCAASGIPVVRVDNKIRLIRIIRG